MYNTLTGDTELTPLTVRCYTLLCLKLHHFFEVKFYKTEYYNYLNLCSLTQSYVMIYVT